MNLRDSAGADSMVYSVNCDMMIFLG